MPVVSIFPDGRAAGSSPISGSDFTTKDFIEEQGVSEEEMMEIFGFNRDFAELSYYDSNENWIGLVFEPDESNQNESEGS